MAGFGCPPRAAGPDVFYFKLRGSAIYSDYTHYCRTNELANNMKGIAGSDPKLRAFAFGWLAHVAEDSTAHPWVNGFTGGPFDSPFSAERKQRGGA